MQIIELNNGYTLVPDGNKVIALKSDPTNIISWGEYSIPKSLDPNDYVEVERPSENEE